jgi:protein phosphatase
MATIDSAGHTDVGRKRKGNEDSYFFDDDLRLYVVADGMGGHAAGEVASRIVVDTMRDFVRQFTDNPAGAAQLPLADQRLSPETNLLLNAVHLSNRAVHEKARKNVKYKGMGSTVSAVLFGDGKMSVVNVGDSPIYLICNDTVEVVSTPHTMMDEYREMAPSAARNVGSHLRHVLTRAMGLYEKVQPDARDITLSGGEVVVICSDGLSDKVTAEEIREVVTKERPERSVKSLVNMANERGGEDNITVIVARWGKEGPGNRPVSGPAGQKKTPPGESRFAVDYDTEEASHRTHVSEIRTDGVFLQTTEAVAVGESILLTLTPEQGGEPVMLSGRVASRRTDGMDVRFEALTPAQRQWLESVARK